ncbi:MAG: hypothetical protein WD598_04090 [Acidimicrobiia bacterium]
MRRTWILITVACTWFGLAATTAAASATRGVDDLPVLQEEDLGRDYLVSGEPTVSATTNQVVIDGDECTQSIGPIPDLEEAVIVLFGKEGSDTPLFSEASTTFATARAAKASFRERSQGVADAIECGTVDVLRPNTEEVLTTQTYDKVPFPKIGDQTLTVTVSFENTSDIGVTVMFRSGTSVVFLNSFAIGEGPTVKQLKAIAKKAKKRLAAEA